MLAGPIADIDVERRKLARHPTIGKPGKGVERIKLIAPTGLKGAAKVLVEEILAANRDGQRFVGLGRQRRFLSSGHALSSLSDRLSRSTRIEPIRDSVFELVRVSNCVDVIETQDVVKVVDA